MLRINLLPAYLEEQKKRNVQYTLAVLTALLLIGGALAYHFLVLQPSVDDMERQASEMDTRATEVETLKGQTDTLVASIQPLTDKVKFVKQTRWYNGLRPRIFEQVARYTYNQVEYNSMAVQGDSLSIKGRVKKLSDAANYYLAMSANPDVKAVGWNGIYGWPNNKQQVSGPGQPPDPNARGFDIDVAAQLISPVVTPTPPTNGGGGAAGGTGAGVPAPGPGGMGGGYGGGAGMSAPGPGGMAGG